MSVFSFLLSVLLSVALKLDVFVNKNVEKVSGFPFLYYQKNACIAKKPMTQQWAHASQKASLTVGCMKRCVTAG